MPVLTIGSEAALKNMRATSLSRWPKRGEGNRLEPIATPSLQPTFRIAPGSTVFTIGSCFARHVEAALEQQGFVVPTRQFWNDDPSGAAVDNLMLNNYGAPSIYNEIAWALGELAFEPDHHFIEVRPGMFADQHLSGHIPLQTYEAVLARRNRIFEVTRRLLDSDTLIMTLGLAEAWKDNKSGAYLNTRPLQSTVMADPSRYQFHVLSFEEIRDTLLRTFAIIFRHCSPDLRVLLSVSPVPMTATFSGMDVLVANQYSKSVLRAAAGTLAQMLDRVDYLPTYESVVYSDRKSAWEDDQVHVRTRVVEANVAAMMSAYTSQNYLPSRFGDSFAQASEDDFSRLADAQKLLSDKRYEEAIAAAAALAGSPAGAHALRVAGTAHLELEQYAAAEQSLRQAISLRANHGGVYGLLGRALLGQDRPDDAVVALEMATRYAPDVPVWLALYGRTLIALGRIEDAKGLLPACDAFPDHAGIKQFMRRLTASSIAA